MLWDGKPYHSLDYELKNCFGEKVYKLALDAGMTCPNRDGMLGSRGCIFCSQGGSGEFAQGVVAAAMAADRQAPDSPGGIDRQIRAAQARVAAKMPRGGRYIAYFQSYTNTYAPVERLEKLFTEAIQRPEIAALSIATRPDCLPGDVLDLLKRLNDFKPVWVELGLQTIHPATADWIRRGYPLSCFEQAYRDIKAAGLTAIVHVILGLPTENREMMLSTARYLGRLPADGVKLQLLHILKGTDLAELYEQEPFPTLSLEEYLDLVIDCISLLPPETVIHRVSGDGPKSLLIAPAWSANKRLVLNSLAKRFKERGEYQGSHYRMSHPSGDVLGDR